MTALYLAPHIGLWALAFPLLIALSCVFTKQHYLADIPAGATEVVVPIDAKVAVGEPYLFAITVEPPGGVVVSSRERIALVAQPTTGA